MFYSHFAYGWIGASTSPNIESVPAERQYSVAIMYKDQFDNIIAKLTRPEKEIIYALIQENNDQALFIKSQQEHIKSVSQSLENCEY